MNKPILRCKLRVAEVTHTIGETGGTTQERVKLHAVYSADQNSENAQWSKWTPKAKKNKPQDIATNKNMNVELKPVTSSNINSAGYSAETRTLIVEFKGGSKYKYSNVAPELWKEFEATFSGENGKSAGKHFYAHIRHLPCEKVEE